MHAYPPRARGRFSESLSPAGLLAVSLFRSTIIAESELYIISRSIACMCVACISRSRRVGAVARDSTGVPCWSSRRPAALCQSINDLFNTCKAAASLANYVRYACRNILCDRLPHDEQTVRLLYVLRVTLPCCFAVPNHRCQMTNPILRTILPIFVP